MRTPAVVKQSRAREERKGVVYFIADHTDDVVKIGFTYDVKNRLADLQTGNSRRLDLYAWFYAEPHVETRIHKFFHGLRTRNEWFVHDARVNLIIRVMENFEFYHGLATGNYSPCFDTEMFASVEELYALEYHKYVDAAIIEKLDSEREVQRKELELEMSE